MSFFSPPKPKEDPEAARQRKRMEDEAAIERDKQAMSAGADNFRRIGTGNTKSLFSAGYGGFPRTLGGMG